MNARELHLNNFVLKNGVGVCLDSPYKLFKALMESDDYEAIDVDKPFFEKIKKNGNFNIIDDFTLAHKKFINLKLKLDIKNEFYISVLFKDIEINVKYEIHSLQNFWYALVREELNVDFLN